VKVLLYNLYAAGALHNGIMLEVAERHLLEGDDVYVVGCDAQLPACDVNESGSLHKCACCISRRRAGLRLLCRWPQYVTHSNVTREQWRQIDSLFPVPLEQDALKSLTFENFDVGMAVLSSLISRTRDADVDVSEHGDLVLRWIRASMIAYFSTWNWMRCKRPDKVYVYNGRLCTLRAVLRAAQRSGVECEVLELGWDVNRFQRVQNTLLHDLSHIQQKILDCWNDEPDLAEKRGIAEAFHQKRVTYEARGYTCHALGQNREELPADWEPVRTNVVLFNSSEDEMAAIGREWRNPVYASQADGVEQIVASCRQGALAETVHVYLRCHPNLQGLDNRYMRRLRKVAAPNFTFIEPVSPVSTYALMREADKVVTFGSTAGIEAACLGKPVILAGRSFYDHLDATYNARNHEDVVRLLAEDLKPKPVVSALKYVYYVATLGEPFRYLELQSTLTGTFRGSAFSMNGRLAALGRAVDLSRGLRARMLRPLFRFCCTHEWLLPILHGLRGRARKAAD